MLGLFGPMVLQRRFFEINWEKRRITYFNESLKDGDFHRGSGKEKHIPMASIVRIVHPSRRLGLGFSRLRRAAAFDIETPDRSFTLVPIVPDPSNKTPTADKLSTPLEPTVTVEDFKVCIADSNFSPRDAPTQLGRLLLKREITDSGTPWEFECPLTLDIMEDPVRHTDLPLPSPPTSPLVHRANHAHHALARSHPRSDPALILALTGYMGPVGCTGHSQRRGHLRAKGYRGLALAHGGQ